MVDGTFRITSGFVSFWDEKYDLKFQGSEELQVELQVRDWVAARPQPKSFDKKHFVKAGWWKSRRQIHRYEQNDEALVTEATRFSYEASAPALKLHILTVLDGVQVPVASALLHFLQPEEFPIFDKRVRNSLSRAGLWRRGVSDQSLEAWLEYVPIMRGLARNLGVSLRTLDKALWAFDKWDPT